MASGGAGGIDVGIGGRFQLLGGPVSAAFHLLFSETSEEEAFAIQLMR